MMNLVIRRPSILNLVLAAILLCSLPGQVHSAQAQGLTFPAQVNKSFTPISIAAGGTSLLSITIFNPNSFEMILQTSPEPAWEDTLPTGMSFAADPQPTTTCGGTVTTTGGVLALLGGSVPAKVDGVPGSCTVTVRVTSITPGNLVNTIPANALNATDPGGENTVTNSTPASATLQVTAVQTPSLNKGFAPNTLWAGQVSTLTVTITNNDSANALTQVSLTDNLPAGVVVANPPLPANWNTNCGASAEVRGPGGLPLASGDTSLTLVNGSINPSAACSIKVNVTSSIPDSYTNIIPARAIQTQQSVTNSNAASAVVNFQAISLDKSFSPASIMVNGESTLSILLSNPSGSPYTSVEITDRLPAGLSVASAPDSPQCGGTVDYMTDSITLRDGIIPAGSYSTPGTCVLRVRVTAAVAAGYTNTLGPGALSALSGSGTIITNVVGDSANLTVYGSGLGISGASKPFNPTTIPVGGVSRLSINIPAPADTDLDNFSITDTLPEGVQVAPTPNPAKNGNCVGSSFSPAAGATQLTYSGGRIPAGTTCTLAVNVTSQVPGVYTNTISPANIDNTQKRNIPGNLTSTLTVTGFTVSKAFYPPVVNSGGLSTLTITLTNTNTSQLDNVQLTDNLPGNLVDGVVIAPTPRASTTCASGSLVAEKDTQQISLSGAIVPAQVLGVNGICTISVDVVGKGAATTHTNRISANTVTGTIHGTATQVSNPSEASATLQVRTLTVGIVKGFDPLTVFGGSSSTMTVRLTNPNTVALTGITFTDNLPQGASGGMKVASPANANTGTCGGTLSAAPGAASFTYSGVTLAASSSCTMTLSVTMNVNANLTNTIPADDPGTPAVEGVTTSNGAKNPDPASATLTNLPGASVSKLFSPSSTLAGGVSLLTITIQNAANFGLDGMGLVDDLPSGLLIAADPPAENTCGGLLQADPGSGHIELQDGVLGGIVEEDDPAVTCVIRVPVSAASAGSYNNCIPIGTLDNNQDASNSTAACDTLSVTVQPDPPSIQKAFSPTLIAAGSTSALTFTLRNPASNTVALSGVSFKDVLPAGMTVASVPNPVQCGGTVSSTANSVTLSGGSLAVNSTCTVSVSVTASARGIYHNTSGAVTSTNGGTGNQASASLTVIEPPAITKTFTPDLIAAGNTATLEFTITNPNTTTVLSGVAFQDVFPTGLRVAADPNAGSASCNASSTPVFAPSAGSTSLSFSSGSIAASGTCTLHVDVTADGGTYPNTTGRVTSTNGGAGNTASDTLTAAGPGLSLLKTRSSLRSGFTAAGETIEYTYTLTNTGDVPLYEPFTVADDHLGSPPNTPFACGSLSSLDPGDSLSCSATYTVQPADVSAKSVLNTATAGAQDAAVGGSTVTSNPSSVSVPLESLTLKKTTSTVSYRTAGNTINYTYTLTNSGSATLYGTGSGGKFTISDDRIGTPPGTPFTCGTAVSLAPGANVSCSAVYTVTAGDVTAASVTNTALGYARDAASQDVTSNPGSVSVYLVSPPVISKSFSPNPSAVGANSLLTFTITNPAGNVVPLTGVNFSDTFPAGLSVAVTPDALQCGGTVSSTTNSISLSGGTILANNSCSVAVQVTAGTAGSYPNQSGNVGSTNGGTGNRANDTLVVVSPPVIIKAFSPTAILVGGSSRLTLTITNPNAAVKLTGVGFTDLFPAGLQVASPPNASTASCDADGAPVFAPLAGDTSLAFSGGSLAGGAVCSVQVDVTGTTPGMKYNTTSPVVSTEGGSGASSNTASLMVNDPRLELTKSITSVIPYHQAGDIIQYAYLLKNTGNVTLIGNGVGGLFTVTDDKAAVTCPATPAGLAPDESITCTADYSVIQADLDNGSVTNTATGHGLFEGTPVNTGQDSEEATAEQSPELTLDKSLTPPGSIYTAPGDLLTYEYELENTGNVTLTGGGPGGLFTVTDDHIGTPPGTAFTCGTAASLAPGETLTCSASYAVTQADLDAGSVTNTAAGHGLFGATPVDSDEDTVTAGSTQSPELTLEKSLTPPGLTFTAPGDLLTYAYELENTGNVTLTGGGPGGLFTITDDHIGTPPGTAFTCGTATSLAPGETLTCSTTYAVTLADLDAGSVTNAAAGHGLFGVTPVDSDEDTATADAVQNPGLSIAKSVTTGEPFAKVGDVVTYEYELENTGNVTLGGNGPGGLFTVSDDHIGTPPGTAFTCGTVTSLAPGETLTCSAVYAVTQDDLDAGKVVNKAAGHGLFDAAPVDSDEDSAEAGANQDPALSLSKKLIPEGQRFTRAGEEITYEYELENTGNVTLTGNGSGSRFTITDDHIGTPPGTAFVCGTETQLAPGETLTCTALYTITQDDMDGGSVINKAAGHAVFGNDPVDSNEAQALALSDQALGLALVKRIVPEDDVFTRAGEVVTYEYTLRNTGTVTLSGNNFIHQFTITDDHIGTPPGTAFTCGTVTSLAPGETLTCSAEYTTTQDDMDQGSVTNLAVGHAVFETIPVDSNEADATVSSTQSPKLTLTKSAASGNPFNKVGDAVTYNYLLENTGNVSLTGSGPAGIFTVTDDKTTVTCPPSPTRLAPTESLTCTSTYLITPADMQAESVTNQATAHAVFEDLPVDSNEDTVTVDVRRGALTGLVYHDANLNQVRDLKEAALEGVTVQVYDASGETLVATAVSAADGTFSVLDLLPRGYVVLEKDPMGYVSTTLNSLPVTVLPGETARVEYGDRRLPGSTTNTVKGVVYDDLNRNGVQNRGEPPLAGVAVTLLNQNGEPVGSTTTNDSGRYAFTRLPAGIYTVNETNPPNYASTTLDSVGVVLISRTVAVVNYGDETGTVLTVDPAVTKHGSPALAKIGDLVVFTITLGNNGPADALDVVLTDTKPGFLDIIQINVSPDRNFPTTILGNTVSITFGTVRPGDVYTITMLTRVNRKGRSPGGQNQVSIQTSSNPEPLFNDNAVVRVGIPGAPQGGEDDDSSSSGGAAAPGSLPATGFAPNRQTTLPPMTAPPDDTSGGLTIEIPALGVNTGIVGLPLSGGTWDASWLGKRLGYLDGTAFPTLPGNSVITGHVYGADGLPGPLINLGSLKWGDRVIVHAFGQSHIYEVRSVADVGPDDTSAFEHQELPWITLVTCKRYNAASQSYELRTLVKAVLVSVQDDPAP